MQGQVKLVIQPIVFLFLSLISFMLLYTTYSFGKERYLYERTKVESLLNNEPWLKSVLEAGCEGTQSIYVVEREITFNSTHICDVECFRKPCHIIVNKTKGIVNIKPLESGGVFIG